MSKYRKKPVVIDAVQYLGLSEPVIEALDIPADQVAFTETGGLLLRTLESGKGHHFVADGDWIIKGVAGEFYPCKPEIFAKTYEDAFAVPEVGAREKALADVLQRVLDDWANGNTVGLDLQDEASLLLNAPVSPPRACGSAAKDSDG